MARVARDAVLVVDNVFLSETAEEAERLRDPAHVRNYSEAEWRDFLEARAYESKRSSTSTSRSSSSRGSSGPATPEADASRVRELLADRIEDGWIRLDRIALRAAKS